LAAGRLWTIQTAAPYAVRSEGPHPEAEQVTDLLGLSTDDLAVAEVSSWGWGVRTPSFQIHTLHSAHQATHVLAMRGEQESGRSPSIRPERETPTPSHGNGPHP
jgi:hypothetical protein